MHIPAGCRDRAQLTPERRAVSCGGRAEEPPAPRGRFFCAVLPRSAPLGVQLTGTCNKRNLSAHDEAGLCGERCGKVTQVAAGEVSNIRGEVAGVN